MAWQSLNRPNGSREQQYSVVVGRIAELPPRGLRAGAAVKLITRFLERSQLGALMFNARQEMLGDTC